MHQGPWTVGGLLKSVASAWSGQRMKVLLAVCVLPGLWMVPATIVHSLLVAEDEPIFGPGRSPLAVAVSLGTQAWNSVWYPGQMSCAIDAVRGQPVRWRAFLTGLPRAPLLFLSTAVVSVPFELVAVLPFDAPKSEFLSPYDAAGLVLMTYLLARTCLWAPILVETRVPFWKAAKESWALTRGSVTKLVVVGMILFSIMMLGAIVELAFADHAHVSFSVGSALFALAVAAFYVRVYAEPPAESPLGASPGTRPARPSA